MRRCRGPSGSIRVTTTPTSPFCPRIVQGVQFPVSHDHSGFEGLPAKPSRASRGSPQDRALPVPEACKVDLDRVAEHPLYESAEVPRRELPAEVVALALHDAGREGRWRRVLRREEAASPHPPPTPTEFQQPSRSPGERAREGRQRHGRHALFTNADRLTCDIRLFCTETIPSGTVCWRRAERHFL